MLVYSASVYALPNTYFMTYCTVEQFQLCRPTHIDIERVFQLEILNVIDKMFKRTTSTTKSEKSYTKAVAKPSTTIDQYFAVDKKKNEPNIEQLIKNESTQSADFYTECLSNVIKQISKKDACSGSDTNEIMVIQENDLPLDKVDIIANQSNIDNNSDSRVELCRNPACKKEVKITLFSMRLIFVFTLNCCRFFFLQIEI